VVVAGAVDIVKTSVVALAIERSMLHRNDGDEVLKHHEVTKY